MTEYLAFRSSESGFIGVTQRCNAKCPHCYANCGRGKPHLSLERAKKAVKLFLDNMYFDSYNADGIEIEISGGEALIHPDLIKILKYGKELSGNIKYSIWSNGIALKTKEGKKLAKRLKKEDAYEITISDDIFHPEIDVEEIKEEYSAPLYPKVESSGRKKHKTIYAIGRGKNLKKAWSKEILKKCGSYPCGSLYKKYDNNKGRKIDVINYSVDFEGKLRYCRFYSGFLGDVDEGIDKIEERFEKDLVFQSIHEKDGLTKLFEIASEINPEYDYLPANCARCHAITRDEELFEKIQERLRNENAKMQ